ncbi:MAG: amylo-alpha-1,6-glucosidase [Clostridia bacterium]|nr:amylo-alpha-1,6-glucosidase [Clostridia bacterium]
MEFGKSSWKTFERGIEKEWLLTNGIGGFASSTIIGVNTRRYHGLLVASLNPPVKRHLVLSKIDESIIINDESYNLYSYQTPDYIMRGYLHLQRVIVDHIPTFIYHVRDVLIEKKITMVYGENTVAVVYHIINGSGSTRLKLSPLVNFRDYHHNSNRDFLNFTRKSGENGVVITPSYYDIDIQISCSEGNFIKEDNCYFLNMLYSVERERGLQAAEDHYIPGYFEVDIKPFEEKYITVLATVEKEIKHHDGLTLIREEEQRVKLLIEKAGYKDPFAQRLVKAADAFIVDRKSTGAKTVIAGYPWFTDWGRDTMIALPGLTLSTKRFDDAKDILYSFSRYVRHGLVPNMFPDEGQEPVYNTVDAALWYFEAVNKYVDYTKDFDFIKDSVYTRLKEIVSGYEKGTLFHIKMDEDFLISAGDAGTQLTWMDAKVGDWVVTPRHGKAVEINALWHNALMVMARLAKQFGEESSGFEELAANVKESFVKLFWNEEGRYLNDIINGSYRDDRIRPNQILAVSLSFPVIEGEMAKKVVEKVWKELYTGYGLRTLSPGAREYRGIYIGDQYSRDGAYHQGTVWTWPLGHFITAFVRVNGNTKGSIRKALMLIEPIKDHIEDACIGSISEIFDGDEPLNPRGCFAQAWSVAEILRAYSEDIGAQ